VNQRVPAKWVRPAKLSSTTLLAAALIALLAVSLVDGARLMGSPFPGFIVWDNGTLVSFHRASWTGVREGLPLNGGRVVAVEGRDFSGGEALLRTVRAAPLGTRIEYRIATLTGERNVGVESMTLSPVDYASTFGIYLANALSFLLTALIALHLRPDLPAARSLALACICMGALLALTLDYFTTYRLVRAYQMLEALTPLALAQFALVFPVPRFSRGRRTVILAGFAVVGVALGLTNWMTFHSDPELARRVTYAIYLLIAGLGLASVVSFGEALLRAPSPADRMRAAAVFAGGLVAIVVPAILVLTFFLLGWLISFSWVTILLPIFPAAILYAVVRHDLLGVERFVRLTVGYGISTAFVVLGYATSILLLDTVLERGTADNPATSFLLLIAIALGFDPTRRRVQRGLDRVFFRSNVDVAEVLESSSIELAGLAEEDSITEQVEQSLQAALEVTNARLLLGEELAAPDPETGLSVPVRFRGERLGVLRCGSKRSGAPFSEAELDLVEGLASQAALALQNARSIRELRTAQDQLLRAERLAAIGELAGAVAHGIRNPLAGIRATAQIALEEDPTGPQAESMRAVLHETDRLDQRVSTLLDFSRPFEPQPRRVDLATIVDSVRRAVETRAAREHKQIRVALPGVAVAARVDPDYLEEALLELTANALRAVPSGGTVWLELEEQPNLAILRVRDDGPGIPAGVRHRVFELFFTTREEGTGMGLAMVKRLVETMGGRVVLESSGATGTTFRIEIRLGGDTADAP
jgi:signal transduction histidine kinase